jgi:anti-sigma regulatory factor (Ser/Thr protein kinase)
MIQREVDSPAAARRWLGALLSEVAPQSMDDACLLVSELVTNAFLHGGGSPTVRANLDGGELFLSVSDTSSAQPVPRPLGTADDSGGLGLVIVQRLTSSWGADTVSGGKVVWARMPLT